MISNTIGSRADKPHETDIKLSEHVLFCLSNSSRKLK